VAILKHEKHSGGSSGNGSGNRLLFVVVVIDIKSWWKCFSGDERSSLCRNGYTHVIIAWRRRKRVKYVFPHAFNVCIDSFDIPLYYFLLLVVSMGILSGPNIPSKYALLTENKAITAAIFPHAIAFQLITSHEAAHPVM
jgi:hypothetical protein